MTAWTRAEGAPAPVSLLQRFVISDNVSQPPLHSTRKARGQQFRRLCVRACNCRRQNIPATPQFFTRFRHETFDEFPNLLESRLCFDIGSQYKPKHIREGKNPGTQQSQHVNRHNQEYYVKQFRIVTNDSRIFNKQFRKIQDCVFHLSLTELSITSRQSLHATDTHTHNGTVLMCWIDLHPQSSS